MKDIDRLESDVNQDAAEIETTSPEDWWKDLGMFKLCVEGKN